MRALELTQFTFDVAHYWAKASDGSANCTASVSARVVPDPATVHLTVWCQGGPKERCLATVEIQTPEELMTMIGMLQAILPIFERQIRLEGGV